MFENYIKEKRSPASEQSANKETYLNVFFKALKERLHPESSCEQVLTKHAG